MMRAGQIIRFHHENRLFICVVCETLQMGIEDDEIFHRSPSGSVCGQWCLTTEHWQARLI